MLNQPTDNQKRDAGIRVVTMFQNLAVEWYGTKWKYSKETLIQYLENNNIDFFIRLGGAVISSGLGLRRLNESMERVLDKMPINPIVIPSTQAFITGITEELNSYDFSLFADAALQLGEAVKKPLVDVVEGVGDSASFLGKNLKIIVTIIVGVLIFAGYGYIKKK